MLGRAVVQFNSAMRLTAPGALQVSLLAVWKKIISGLFRALTSGVDAVGEQEADRALPVFDELSRLSPAWASLSKPIVAMDYGVGRGSVAVAEQARSYGADL